DFRPYLYKTTDYGKTWTKIVRGIKEGHFTRVIRADPGRPGLLYAGTENGMYISFDDGGNLQPFQLNLPIVPITDLTIKNNDLIVATQGRSFWVLDDLTPLHQQVRDMPSVSAYLVPPRATYRLPGGASEKPSLTEGQNPPAGVVIHYYLRDKPAKDAALALEVRQEDGTLIQRFTPTDAAPAADAKPLPKKGQRSGGQLLAKQGVNRFVWDMQYPAAEDFPGLVLWGTLPAPRAVPGKYQARLQLGTQVVSAPFEILPDPRSRATPEDYRSQFQFVLAVRDKLTETHRAIKQLRDVRDQLGKLRQRLDQPPAAASPDGVARAVSQVKE